MTNVGTSVAELHDTRESLVLRVDVSSQQRRVTMADNDERSWLGRRVCDDLGLGSAVFQQSLTTTDQNHNREFLGGV